MEPRVRRFATAVAIATVVVLALLGGTAYAAWSIAGSGNGSARAGSLNAPAATATALSSTSIRVTWTVGTQPPGTSYSVVRNGTTTLTCSTSPCADTGLTPNTTYTYVVTAALHAWAQPSSPVPATTAPSVATKFAVSISDGVIAGANTTIKLTAQDADNNTVANYANGSAVSWGGTASASSPTGTAPTLTTTGLTWVNGIATLQNQKLTLAGMNLTLSATQGTLSGSTTTSVTAGAPSRLGFTSTFTGTAPGTPVACLLGGCTVSVPNNGSVTTKVSVLDAFGNLTVTPTRVDVTWTKSAGTLSYVPASPASMFIAANASESGNSVRLTDNGQFSDTLTASGSGGLSPDVTLTLKRQ